MDYDYIVLGGGISGLSSAFFLKKNGLNGLVLESKDKVGGILHSKTIGEYTLDFGANSASLTPEFEQLIKDLNLEDELLTAEAISNKRYLFSNNQFHAVEPNPVKILKSKLLTAKAKYRLFTESWRKKNENPEDESVAEFVTRRFGKEILEKVFDPVLSGIYAGDVQKLSMQQVMPSLVNWEKEYGSITKGVFKNAKSMKPRKIVNFKGGFATLVSALEKKLEEEILTSTIVIAIEFIDNLYVVFTKNSDGKLESFSTKKVISTLPSYVLSKLVSSLDTDLVEPLRNIEYTTMNILHIGFKKQDVQLIPQGFGFLVPSIEKRKFLGAINQSLIFPEKAPTDIALLTVFYKHHSIEEVIIDLKEVLKTNAEPVFQETFKWEFALPQFNVGYKNILDRVEAFEKNFPSFYVQGNWRTGVAVGNIIENAFLLSEKIKK